MDRQQQAAFCVMYHLLKNRNKGKKKCWVRKWIQRRQEHGACTTLVNELRIEDSKQFVNLVRMTALQVEVMIQLNGDLI